MAAAIAQPVPWVCGPVMRGPAELVQPAVLEQDVDDVLDRTGGRPSAARRGAHGRQPVGGLAHRLA